MQEGKIVSNYTFVRKIESSVKGEVWEVEKNGKTLVVKIVDKNKCENEFSFAKFLSPFVVKYIETFEDKNLDVGCVVMELCPQETNHVKNANCKNVEAQIYPEDMETETVKEKKSENDEKQKKEIMIKKKKGAKAKVETKTANEIRQKEALMRRLQEITMKCSNLIDTAEAVQAGVLLEVIRMLPLHDPHGETEGDGSVNSGSDDDDDDDNIDSERDNSGGYGNKAVVQTVEMTECVLEVLMQIALHAFNLFQEELQKKAQNALQAFNGYMLLYQLLDTYTHPRLKQDVAIVLARFHMDMVLPADGGRVVGLLKDALISCSTENDVRLYHVLQALSSLANSRTSERNGLLLCVEGVIPLLLPLFRCSNLDISGPATRLLWNMCRTVRGPGLRRSLLAAGFFPAARAALDEVCAASFRAANCWLSFMPKFYGVIMLWLTDIMKDIMATCERSEWMGMMVAEGESERGGEGKGEDESEAVGSAVASTEVCVCGSSSSSDSSSGSMVDALVRLAWFGWKACALCQGRQVGNYVAECPVKFIEMQATVVVANVAEILCTVGEEGCGRRWAKMWKRRDMQGVGAGGKDSAALAAATAAAAGVAVRDRSGSRSFMDMAWGILRSSTRVMASPTAVVEMERNRKTPTGGFALELAALHKTAEIVRCVCVDQGGRSDLGRDSDSNSEGGGLRFEPEFGGWDGVRVIADCVAVVRSLLQKRNETVAAEAGACENGDEEEEEKGRSTVKVLEEIVDLLAEAEEYLLKEVKEKGKGKLSRSTLEETNQTY